MAEMKLRNGPLKLTLTDDNGRVVAALRYPKVKWKKLVIESEDDAGEVRRALIDSNDTTTLRSSYIFLRRHLENDPGRYTFVLNDEFAESNTLYSLYLARDLITGPFFSSWSLSRSMELFCFSSFPWILSTSTSNFSFARRPAFDSVSARCRST